MTHDAQIEALEARLRRAPNDIQVLRRLVTRLDQMPPDFAGEGRFTVAQRLIANSLPEDWQLAFLHGNTAAESYGKWQGALRKAGITRAVPIGQIFAGRLMTIKGTHAHCGERLKFFAQTGAISALCNDCYKVQILPSSLETLIRVYFLLINLRLPNDNARKCMIELRDGIKYPYKAYIYCESIAEVQECLAAFQRAQAEVGIAGVRSQISHGCSEYSQAYPAFKFDEHSRDAFRVPSEWARIEREYFGKIALTPPKRTDNSKPLISLRDVFAFRTWAEYAELIGDPSAERFKNPAAPDLPPVFLQRVTAQAAKRWDELAELVR